MKPTETHTGMMVMVVRPRSDLEGKIGEVVNLSLVNDKRCALVLFPSGDVKAWFWPRDLIPAPVIDLLGMVDRP